MTINNYSFDSFKVSESASFTPFMTDASGDGYVRSAAANTHDNGYKIYFGTEEPINIVYAAYDLAANVIASLTGQKIS